MRIMMAGARSHIVGSSMSALCAEEITGEQLAGTRTILEKMQAQSAESELGGHKDCCLDQSNCLVIHM